MIITANNRHWNLLVKEEPVNYNIDGNKDLMTYKEGKEGRTEEQYQISIHKFVKSSDDFV